MYLQEHEETEPGALDGWFDKVKKAMKKSASRNSLAARAVSLNPAMASRRAVPRGKLFAFLQPAGAKVPRGFWNKSLLRVATKPMQFAPRPIDVPSTVGPIALPAPAASIPTEDYDEDGSEITIEERAAYIDDAEPLSEPYSSGYVPDDGEESFAPIVPEMVEPQDLKPEVPAQKKFPAVPIGGLVLLLSLLS